MALDIDAELAKLDKADDKLAAEADKLGKDYLELRQRLVAINTERRDLAGKGQSLRRVRTLGSDTLAGLHQLIQDSGGIESVTEVGVPGAEG